MTSIFKDEYGRWLHHYKVKRLLGVNENKLPSDFTMKPTKIEGVEVYILPSNHGSKGKSLFGHRVMSICPVCGKHTSAGRFHQHWKVHKNG